MSHPLWALFAAVAAWQGVAALAGPGADSSETPCHPAQNVLAADATLTDAAGAYRLTLVAQQRSGKSPSVAGSLLLQPWSSDAFAPASSPLRGATDIDLEAVGAVSVGDPGSKDPAAPGVLVLESRQDGAPRILLRLGSDANRADQPLFDGGFAVLEVAEITTSGFAGKWRSGAEGQFASGHFCARNFTLQPKTQL